MAKPRKKKRTQATSVGVAQKPAPVRDSKSPKSMVIRIGANELGSSVSQLVKDMRGVMEPGTASRLQERRSNRLRDYTSMAGPLGVTHLLLFSRSKTGNNTNMRVALHPRGPTLNFRVEQYSLSKDVQKSQKHPRDGAREYKTSPLLVMNKFITTDDPDAKVPKHLEQLLVSTFQGLFPAMSPQNTPLSNVRRVLLLNREVDGNDGSVVLSLRHYAITTKRTGLSRAVRKINAAEKLVSSSSKKGRGSLPNLGKLKDVSDFLLDPSAAASGFTSGSDTELDTDAEVEVMDVKAKQILSEKRLAARRKREAEAAALDPQEDAGLRPRSRTNVEKRAVKLVELGPRMRLRLTKVEEGLCEGRTMWHDRVTKSATEEKELDERWTERRKEKEARKQQQRENVERKRKERAEKGGKGTDAGADGNKEEEEDEMEIDDDWDSEDYENFGDEDLEPETEDAKME